MIATVVVGGVATVAGAAMQSRSARRASAAQSRSAEMGIQEQRRQFDAATRLFQPYVEAGVGSMGQQQALLGLSGPEAQAQAISQLEQGSLYQSMVQQGEEAILANASATGGLRGGNTQGALAQFRPQMLNEVIQNQFKNLGSLTSMGQASAAKQAAAGQTAGTNIANLYGQQGAAQAGSALAQGNAWGSALGGLSNLFGTYSRFQGLQGLQGAAGTQAGIPSGLNQVSQQLLGQQYPVFDPYQSPIGYPNLGGGI
tara:strand:- start:3988 stop:4755 length:768 start_codon:yes stop_codon:yes gene_type:complete